MSDYFNLNEGAKEVKKKFPELGNLPFNLNKKLLIAFLIAITLPITVFLALNRQELRKFASEDHPGNLIISEDTKPEYVKGEVIVKLVNNLDNSINPAAKSRGISLGKGPVGIENFDRTALPPSIKELQAKYKIKQIGRVFENSKVNTQSINSSNAEKLYAAGLNPTREEVSSIKKDRALVYKFTFENKDLDSIQAVSEIQQSPEVLYAGPNYVYRATQSDQGGGPTPPTDTITPTPTPGSGTGSYFNDPYYVDQYPNNVQNRDPNWNPNFDYQWDMKMINVREGWNLIDRNSLKNVVVAVIDSGVDYTHPDFGDCRLEQLNNKECETFVPGFNFVGSPSEENRDPMDRFGHGTHVAGTIAALTNSIGIAGMASGVKIMPLKGLSDQGKGSSEDLAQAIYYAVDNGAKVINASWGGYGQDYLINEAVSYAYSKGVTFVAAAGNNNVNLDVAYFSPANITCQDQVNINIDCVLTVGANSVYRSISSYSNLGSPVDIFAPGDDILSLKSNVISSNLNDYVVGGQYLRLSGTSMATPHVTALAALILSKNPSLSPREIRNIILNSSSPLSNQEYGLRFIEVKKAISDMDKTDYPISRISLPFKYMLLGNTFKIHGTAAATDFSNFKIEILNNMTDTNSIGEISLAKLGQEEINNDVLASVKLSLTERKLVYIKLTIFSKTGLSHSVYQPIYVDPNIADGYPVFHGSWQGWLGDPLVADLNGDGKDEVYFENTTDAKLNSIDANGKNYSGWPINSGAIPNYIDGNPFRKKDSITPVAIDIDKTTPGKEVVFLVRTQQQVYLLGFHLDGTPVAGWQKNDWDNRPKLGIPQYGVGIVVSKVNNKDVLAYTETYPAYSGGPLKLHLIIDSGEELSGWPVNLNLSSLSYGYTFKSPIIINNGDQTKIIVLKDLSTALVFDAAGNRILEKVLIDPKVESFKDMISADLDSDGNKEIIMLTWGYAKNDNGYTTTVKVHAYNQNFDEISSKWPYVLTKTDIYTRDVQLTVGNFINTNKPQILISFDNKFYLLNESAENLPGSPYDINLGDSSGGSSIVHVKTSTDNSLLAILAQDFYYYLNIINFDGNSFTRNTRLVDNKAQYNYPSWPTRAQIGDFNGDNKADVLFAIDYINWGFSLYENTWFYSYKTDKNILSREWPQYMHDESHSNTYNLNSFTPTPTPTPTEIPTPTLSPTPTPTFTPAPTPAPLKMTINPTADAFVINDQPATNFGTKDNFYVVGNPNTISFLKFNLNSLSGKTIKSAKLYLKVKNALGPVDALKLRRAANVNWSETGITFNNKPGFEAVITNFSAKPVESTVELNVTKVVDLRKGGNLTLGVTSSAPNDIARFYSRESVVANRPKLIIEYQ